uniref:Uncharacterized protein n=1 Tax=Arundo donax TaxID=35708 RepID=A0A0A8YV92_ARUDO
MDVIFEGRDPDPAAWYQKDQIFRRVPMQ